MSAPTGPTTWSGRRAEAITGYLGDDRIDGGFGPDLLLGSIGDDVLEGGPGYDTLRGGAGDDRLSDGSYGTGLLDGGAGDDANTSSPAAWTASSAARAGTPSRRARSTSSPPDCETVSRASAARAPTLTEVRSVSGELLGTTGYRLAPAEATGPYRLLWVNDGYTYLATRFRAAGACLVTVEPSGAGRGECDFGRRGGLFVRRDEGPLFRWFALVPGGVRSLAVGGRTVPVSDGVAVFSGPRHPGRIVAQDDGLPVALRVP